MRFAGVCLITDDVLRLARFYEQLLGTKAAGDAVHCELSAVGLNLAIFSKSGMRQMAPGSLQGAGTGSFTLNFQVSDVDAEFERVKSLGVDFVKPVQTHPWGARSFWFRDPDGNIVDLFMVLDSTQSS